MHVGRYIVRTILTAASERTPMVVDTMTSLPANEAVIYATSLCRPASGSHSKVEHALRGVAGFLNLLEERKIDFPARVGSFSFLSIPELDGLVSLLGRQGRPGRRAGERTVATRMRAALRYSSFLVGLHAHALWATPEARVLGAAAKASFLAEMAARSKMPRAKNGTRRGLSTEQEAVLMSGLVGMAREAGASGEAGRVFAADRNALWVDVDIELGLRTGELLGIRLQDVDLNARTIRIVRRPDAPDDPRKELARVKGEGRELDVSPYLAARLGAHVNAARASRPGANKHEFLFVSVTGAPLSRSGVNKMFVRLRRNAPILGEDFCNHRLRHHWNERFSEDSAAAGLSPAEEATARAYAQGWRSEASAVAYLTHRTRKRAAEVSRISQVRQMGVRVAAGG